ncbi:MAG: Nucleoid-associated protein [Myxococcota bacterium]|nr:Nucleoid-associated protein [Myxococcota bacterium]
MIDPAKFDLNGLLQQAQGMTQRIREFQEQMANRRFEGSAGGGMVKAAVNGKFEVLGVTIDPQAIDPAEPAMLEDLCAAAVNQAIRNARETMQQEMQRIAGGMVLPGLMNF